MIDTIAMRRNISEIWAAIFGSEAEATVGELKIIDLLEQQLIRLEKIEYHLSVGSGDELNDDGI